MLQSKICAVFVLSVVYCAFPNFSNSAHAICVVDGIAFSNVSAIEVLSCFNVECLRFLCFCCFCCFDSNVQTPFGPRKSEIPQEVEIPAPIKYKNSKEKKRKKHRKK